MITFAQLSIDVSHYTTPVALVALLVSLLFSLRYAKERLATHQPWRFSAVVVLNTVASLVLAAWLSNLSIKEPGGQRILLITDNGQPSPDASFDAAFDASYDASYRLTPDANDKQSQWITDPAVIRLAHPNLSELTVQGYGLSKDQWRHFNGVSINHHAPEIDAGLVDLRWPQQLLSGNELTITAKYQQADNTNEIMTVKLLDPVGTVVSTARVKNQESLSLTAIPKAMGHYLYRLQISNESDEVVNEQVIPVEVSGAPAAKILVIQSAPSFENKHLKNWASAQGASLLLLTTISKDKFITQSVNLPEQTPTRLSPAMLNHFDLLIMDGRALLNRSPNQQQWLTEAVTQGLGLFITGDSLLAAKTLPPVLSTFSFTPITNLLTTNPTVIPHWPGKRKSDQSELAFAYLPMNITALDGIRLVRNKAQTLSLYQSKGLGKVAVSVLKGRYHWLLSSDKQTYTHYWQWLFSQLARTRSDSRFIAPAPNAIDQTNKRSPICIISEAKNLTLLTKHTQLPLATEGVNPYRQCAFYWPKTTGWQRFELQDTAQKNQDTSYRYTFEPNAWQSWQQHKRAKATSEFINARQQKSPAHPIYKPINPTWYWWLLVICASVLWVERKFD
ncbi:MAG: hypothetical protein ACI9FJ_001790 [Alteromonadaceae bacterium]|jgi:hypothetical protein